jgi:hypothetical protein
LSITIPISSSSFSGLMIAVISFMSSHLQPRLLRLRSFTRYIRR